MKYFALVFILLVSTVMADDQGRFIEGFDVKADIIADNYEAGNALIYDCVEKHWVCVRNTYFDECREKRAKARQDESLETLPCAPIAFFPTKKSCFQRQLFMTTHHHGDRFCIKDEWKLKAAN